MSPTEIYQDILLLDKSITLQFPSLAALNSFRSNLHGVRKKIREQSISLGMGDCEGDDLELQCHIRKEATTGTVAATFKLAPARKRHPTFTIISVEDSSQPESPDP